MKTMIEQQRALLDGLAKHITEKDATFDTVLKPFFERHIRLQTLSDHPNTTLTDLFHAMGCQQHSVVKEADGATVRYDGECFWLP